MKTVGASLFDRRKTSKLNIFVNVVLVLLVIICVSEFAFSLRFISIWVDGRSMLPTITGEDKNSGLKGEYVFADKSLKPDYGDIVVVKRTVRIGGKENTNFIIKRVVAFGGDYVKMESGVLFIKRKGEEEYTEVKEEYVSADHNHKDLPKNSFSEHLVGEGMIYLLGDNRDESNDSRSHGDFSENSVVGVVPEWAMENKTAITGFFNFLNSVFRLRTSE